MALDRVGSHGLSNVTENLSLVGKEVLSAVSVVEVKETSEHDTAATSVQGVVAGTRGSDSTFNLASADLVTADFDALRFNAAASLQILQRVNTSIPRTSKLILSPYNDPDHLLDLRTLDTQNRLLAQALAFMKPIHDEYATADYATSFNWDEVLANLQALAKAEKHQWTEQSFYTVIFRSQLNPNIELQRLHDLDKMSHREATVSGGLLKYWFGKKNGLEKNLATCLLPTSR